MAVTDRQQSSAVNGAARREERGLRGGAWA